MRTYGQYCGVAKALDVIGDRWTLLIVRELLIRGPSRYTDLRNGLPGIATNLLATRLRELEKAGLVESEAAPPPVATTLFRLTPRGEQLETVLAAVGRWGAPFLFAEDGGGGEARGHWLALPLRLYFTDGDPSGPPVSIALHGDGEPVAVEIAGSVRTRVGEPERPDVVVSGPTIPLWRFLVGDLPFAQARKLGVSVAGDSTVLARLVPS